MNSLVIFAQGETTWQMVWMSGIAAALVIIPIIANAFTAWLQTRSLNAASKVQSDKLGRQVEQTTEKIEDAQKARLEQTKIIVGASKETEKVVQKLTESQLAPQKVEVVNIEPVPVVETEARKK